MPRTELPQTRAATQGGYTFRLGRSHAVSWGAYVQRQLDATRAEMKKPQTRDRHAVLRDREARYACQVARFKAAGVL